VRRNVGGEERKRVFRQMEWYYVWLPPLLLVLFAVLGGLLLAWIVPMRGVELRLRWAVITLLLVLIPLVGRSVRRIGRREHQPPTVD
jgi:hypothetical protein